MGADLSVRTCGPDADLLDLYGWSFPQAQGPQPVLGLGDGVDQLAFVIRDRDTRFTAGFDAVFQAEGVRYGQSPA